MKTPALRLRITRSRVYPDLLSLRLVGGEQSPSATDMRRALVSAGFKDGDSVVLRLRHRPVSK